MESGLTSTQMGNDVGETQLQAWARRQSVLWEDGVWTELQDNEKILFSYQLTVEWKIWWQLSGKIFRKDTKGTILYKYETSDEQIQAQWLLEDLGLQNPFQWIEWLSPICTLEGGVQLRGVAERTGKQT